MGAATASAVAALSFSLAIGAFAYQHWLDRRLSRSPAQGGINVPKSRGPLLELRARTLNLRGWTVGRLPDLPLVRFRNQGSPTRRRSTDDEGSNQADEQAWLDGSPGEDAAHPACLSETEDPENVDREILDRRTTRRLEFCAIPGLTSEARRRSTVLAFGRVEGSLLSLNASGLTDFGDVIVDLSSLPGGRRSNPGNVRAREAEVSSVRVSLSLTFRPLAASLPRLGIAPALRC